MGFIEDLNWRYATKKMNGQRVPQEKIERIIEATRLTPTSSGMQPFQLIVITNQDLKDQIRLISNNQSIVSECSHLFVFAAWDNYTEKNMDMMFDLHNETRGVILDRWENYRKFLKGAYLPRNADINFEHTARQSYIGLGFAMAAAAIEKVDATPMEGFDAAKLDLILHLKEKGLRSVTMLPLGYRDSENDWNVNLKKVRRPKENFVIEYK